jgi:hypothetical protein
MKIYASMKFIEEDGEWINLVLTENADRIMCRTYDSEQKCRYEMIEHTKNILNNHFSSLGMSNDYKIIEVDSTDTDFRALMDRTTKRESRQAKFPFRLISAIKVKTLELMIKVIGWFL